MRSLWLKFLVSALGVVAWACITNAQDHKMAVTNAQMDQTARANAETDQGSVADRKAAAAAIVAHEEAATGRTFDPSYRAEVLNKLATLSLSELASMQSKSGVLPETLGDSGDDLVYTPVTPCRIIDTRNIVMPINPGTIYEMDVATPPSGSYSSQGGYNGSCGIPFGPATAVVVNFVAVGPTYFGDLRIYPYGQAEPNASIINYIPGQNVANGVVLTICNPAVATCVYDIDVVADGNSTQLVADVMGYFKAVNHTYQMLTYTSSTTLLPGYGVRVMVACPAGAQVLGGGLENEFNANVVMVASHPCPSMQGGSTLCGSGPGWEAYLQNPWTSSQGVTTTVYAICAVSP